MEPNPGESPVPDVPAWTADRYRLIVEDRLPGGFHSTVWKAEEVASGRIVAVKLFNRDRAPVGPAEEARRLELLDHPGATRLVEFLPDADGHGTEAIVMELAQGVRIEWTLGASRSAASTLEVVRQIANVLEFAHSRPAPEGPIIHGDVHPGNLVIDEGENRPTVVKLIDWGAVPTRTEPQGTLGHDMYRAPEAWTAVEPASDFWSLGLLAAQVTAGGWIIPYRLDLDGPERSFAMRDKALQMVKAAQSPALEDLTARLLAIEPAERAGAPEVRQVSEAARPGDGKRG